VFDWSYNEDLSPLSEIRYYPPSVLSYRWWFKIKTKTKTKLYYD